MFWKKNIPNEWQPCLWYCIFFLNSLPPPFPKTIPPIFEHFPTVRFGWNFLYRFILGWSLWCLHIFLLNSALPRIPLLPPKIFPLFLNPFPLFNLDETSYIDSFWGAICDVCIFFINSPPPSNSLLFPKPFPLFFEQIFIVQCKSLLVFPFIQRASYEQLLLITTLSKDQVDSFQTLI